VNPRLALAFLLIPLALSCGRFEERAEPRADVPVFIISIDTLRSDRRPAYGYGKGSTPAIEAFRKEAILFRHAFSPCPLTLPSHASLFTGQPPHIHGLRNNLGYTLEASHRSLVSLLKEKGYETGGAVSTFVLRKETGISAGFDFYDDFMTHSPLESATSWQRDGDISRQALSSWIETTHSTKVFGFLHLYEPHSPYSAPTPYSDNRDPYDGEVSYADAITGRFLDELKTRGLYDSALVIILSDHGEGLGDHGEKEHGVFLYRESLQVPLLVKLPGGKRAGESVDRTVALTDVLPTVMEVVGIDGHAAASLLAAAPAKERQVYSETYYPRLQYGWSELVSLIGTDLHYIHAPKAELYRYRVDGEEKQNVVGESRRDAASFRQELRRISEKHPFAQPRAADPEDARKLAALGYVGSTVSTSGALPDPKDKLDVLRLFGSASDHFRTGQYAKAAAMMKELMRGNPDFISGWGLLAESYRKLGRKELALQTLRTQMNHSPGNSQIALSLADLLREMGRYREAREHALLAKESGAAFVHEMLAMIALAENDLEEADREAVASLASEPDRIQALMLRSQIRRLRKRPAEELAFLEKVNEVVRRRHLPAIRDLEFRRGEALLQGGRVPQAEQAFRAETRDFPSHLKAWASLALVVGAQGRRAETRSILDEAMRRNPGREARKLAVETLLTMNDREGAREVSARPAP